MIWYEDKRRARIAAMRSILARLDYPDKAAAPPDPPICGGPRAPRAYAPVIVILAPGARGSPSI